MIVNPLADMHLHSIYSDGELSPRQLVFKAKNAGLLGICLTDHETIDGASEFLNALREFGLKGFVGAEIFGRYRNTVIHFLVYGLNNENWPAFAQIAQQNQKCHNEYAEHILKRYRQAEIMNVDFQEVMQQKINRGPYLSFVDILYYRAKNYNISPLTVRNEIWNNYGKINGLFQNISPFENILSAAKKTGLPVICAHAGMIAQEFGRAYFERMVDDLVASQISGFEVFHPANSYEISRYLSRICLQNHLLKTGGSDYHGPIVKPNIFIGQKGAHAQGFFDLWRLVM